MDTSVNKTSESVKNIALIGLMTAVICIIGPISVTLPFTPVPISLQIFAIYITAYALGFSRSIVSTGIYLLLGAVGLPVFSGYQGGFSRLVGPTGGYLVGYIFIALIVGGVISKFPKKIWLHGLAMVIAVTICYMFGTVWFTIQANVDFKSALYMCVIPFILGDVIKIALALVVGPAIYHALKKANLN